MQKKTNKEKTDVEIKELVIERLKLFPNDKNISIGEDGSFTKDEIIGHVQKDDEIGKKMIAIELSYLKALKSGVLFEE